MYLLYFASVFYGEMGFGWQQLVGNGRAALDTTFKDGISYGLIAFTGGDIQMFIAIFSAILLRKVCTWNHEKHHIKVIIVLWYTFKLITMIAASLL